MPIADSAPPMPTPAKVLVVGGSYAGLATIVNLLDLCNGLPPRFAYEKDPQVDSAKKTAVDITLVDERDGFFHLLGMPMACASRSYADKAWVRYSDIPALKRVRVVRGQVSSIDPLRKVAQVRCSSGLGSESRPDSDARPRPAPDVQSYDYDYLVSASGIHREWPTAPIALSRDGFLKEAGGLADRCANATDGIIVVGGGAVGIEMAAEVKLLNPQQQVTLVHSRQRLLSSEPLADLYKDKVLELVREAGVEVVLGSRVAKQEADATGATTVTLENGHALRASVVIDAISRFSPRHPYLPQKALDEQGYVRITSTLNLPDIVPNSDCHYAAGDIVKWSGIKRAGAAMHHGHLVAQNIHQHLLLQQHKLRPQTDGSETGAFTPNYSHLEAAEPGMCVAIGKKAAAYSDTWGLQEGEETLKLFFEDDLGFNICWKHMGLGIEPPA